MLDSSYRLSSIIDSTDYYVLLFFKNTTFLSRETIQRKEASVELEEKKGWNPYIAGALTGLLLIFSVWFTGKYVGASTTFVRSAGYIEQIFDAERVAQMAYFKKEIPKIDWQFLFVVGIFFGALASSTTSRSFRLQVVPTRWEKHFGPAIPKRAVAAFFGGAIAMFGARLADG
jgi:hypothetical protein